ncbi:T9SS type A sorting domain-containing protein [Flavobacterium sp.]|uniref:T9SS type A sorting domain-containing protein n=1 Tax=Flavobacterium sp. TaxID=239 RepID=UPI0028BF1231|nr:T9SS type A sorting domain-containing protein [Flavobacterium sp.]
MKKITLLIAILFAVFSNSYGQISSYTFAQSSGVYTPVSGGTTVASITAITGTAPSSAERMDDMVYNLPDGTIPFTFVFDGNGYTGLNINSNGYITFGATAPGTTNYTPISSTATYERAISAFARDLEGGYHIIADRTSGSVDLLNASSIGPISVGDFVYGTGIPAGVTVVAINGTTITMSAAATSTGTAGAIRFGAPWSNIQYAIEGVAPNRTFVIQFSNFKRFGTTATTSRDMILNFQFRLEETTNVISIVYGNCSPGTGTTDTTVNQVGLRGATNVFATNVNNRRNTKGTNDNWIDSVVGTSNTSGMLFNTSAPANVISNGLTYVWTPPPACSGTPVAGSATPATQNICSGATPANLVATGYSTGVTGLTFQWEESNDNGVGDAWANAVGGTGATTATYTPPVFSGTTIYYRFSVTCSNSGLSAQTASVMVTVPAAPSNQITAVTIPAGTIAYSQAGINWTNGNGARRAVFISDSATFTDPVDGNGPALTANAVYSGSGQQLIYDGTAATVTVTGLSAATQYYIKAYEYTRCGSGPYDFYFNTTTGTNIGDFTTCDTFTVPALENFTTYVPGCWLEADNGDLVAGPSTFGSSSWAADGFANVGTTGAVKYNIFTTGANDWLMSPLYTIPATGYELKFDAAANQFGTTTAPTTPWEADDFVQVLVSTGSNNWTLLYTYDNANVPSNTGTVNIFDLDAYSGQTVRFAFRAVEGATNGSADIDFSVDNFEIRLTPACEVPTALGADPVTATTANLFWTAGGTESAWNIEWGPTGFTQGTGTMVNGVANPHPLTSGLTASTTYQFYVQADCAANGTSTWAGPFSFTTACDATNVPYSQNFESATVPNLPACTSQVNYGTGNLWTVQNNVGYGFTTNALRYSWNTTNAANVWFFTQGVNLVGGQEYKISYNYGNASATFPEKLKVAYGSSNNAAGMTNILADYANINQAAIQTDEITFTPGSSGVYYFGFQAYSDADEFYLLVDNILVDVNLGSSTFDSTSFKAYPNPVRDVLNLSYSTEISSVEVFNMLGQKVMVKELNVAQGQVDMSNLTSGNYMVKVTAEGQTKTIKVVKQ